MSIGSSGINKIWAKTGQATVRSFYARKQEVKKDDENKNEIMTLLEETAQRASASPKG